MKRREVKIVNKKKVSDYTVADCETAIKVLTEKNQHMSKHGQNVQARYNELIAKPVNS